MPCAVPVPAAFFLLAAEATMNSGRVPGSAGVYKLSSITEICTPGDVKAILMVSFLLIIFSARMNKKPVITQQKGQGKGGC